MTKLNDDLSFVVDFFIAVDNLFENQMPVHSSSNGSDDFSLNFVEEKTSIFNRLFFFVK